MPADCDDLIEALKRAAATLRDAGVPFALGGGLACWAHGAPISDHDVDIMVRPQDADRAQLVLAEAGMRAVRPPEEWLLKAYDGDVLVDLIFRPNGEPVDDAMLARATMMDVAAVCMPVLPLEEVLVSKLLALNEHCCDFEKLIAIARAVREQVDWDQMRVATAASPFAHAFFALVTALGIVPPAEPAVPTPTAVVRALA
jgi:hypothetical protein